MRFIRACAVFFICLVPISAWAWQSDDRHNGDWWVSQTKEYRLSYVEGLLDGIRLGHQFTVTKMLKSGESNNRALSKALDSYDENRRYVEGVTATQVLDKLDQLYADRGNRQICVYDATWIGLNMIAGRRENEINKMIEAYRASQTLVLKSCSIR